MLCALLTGAADLTSTLFAQTYGLNQLPGLFGASVAVMLIICVVAMLLNRLANAAADRRVLANLASKELVEMERLDEQ